MKDIDTDFGDLSIDDMIKNMGEPTSNRVLCPIENCNYKSNVKSVAGHVSASNEDMHIWKNTDYNGWRDFINKNT